MGEAKYKMVPTRDGFDSTQFPTSPLSLVSTLPYLKDWLISDVIRVESPDNTRATLIKAITALSGVFDPTKGEQQLIHAEYAGSYFMAKRQTSSLSNETASPYMVDINIDWACTGPAYSLIEQDIITTLTQRQNTLFTIRSNGDSQASPLWRFYAGGSSAGFVPVFTLTNTTTGESISWSAVLNFGDCLEFIMDPEHGTPYSVLLNGVDYAPVFFSGPAWPHLVPGDNDMLFQQTGGKAIFGLLEVHWRDRFMVGRRELQQPQPQPPYKVPAEITIDGELGEAQGVTRWFGGWVKDIWGHVMVGIPVTLQVSSNQTNYSIVTTVTTDENGFWEYTTSTPQGTWYYRAFWGGDDTHLSTYSAVVTAILPTKISTIMSIFAENTGADYSFYGWLVPSTPGAPAIIGKNVYLQISVNNSAWVDVPNTPPNPTYNDGSYRINYTVGPTEVTDPNSGKVNTLSTRYRAYYPGDLQYAAVASGVITVTDQATLWPAQAAGPIEYIVGLNQEMIQNGQIQYFAAIGFTTVVFVPDPGDMTTHAEELATIKALGMKAVYDVEFVLGSNGPAGGIAQYASYFQSLKDAGWEVVSSEDDLAGDPAYLRNYFSGYMNYQLWVVYGAPYNDPSTTINCLEFYLSSDVATLQLDAMSSSQLGIPGGLLLGLWWGLLTNDPYDIRTNSLTGQAPSFQSMYDWSYSNGVGYTNFMVWMQSVVYPHLCPDLACYFATGGDQIVADLMVSYPPAGTDALISPTILAASLSLTATQMSDNSYTFAGALQELISTTQLSGAPVTLQIQSNAAPYGWSTVSVEGNPATTDANGAYSISEVTLTSGTWYFRTYYSGGGGHVQTWSTSAVVVVP